MAIIQAAREGRQRGEAFGGRDIEHMHDQRIEARPALGLEDAGDGLALRGVRAQPVDGLGGKGDQTAGGEVARGLGYRGLVGAPDRCVGGHGSVDRMALGRTVNGPRLSRARNSA